ncbi:venom metalloproteinase antarease-like TtrivMP_A isoform X2 [Rhipicephalus microplus]|uniref:venom metalloproteinase antarease-like TtrivMP_A isoform X2 n=1 Tax=Rhipicephalus microplus TaxID=6941 RepID=UPI003F6B6CB1
MQKGLVSSLLNLIAYLQLLYSPYTSLGSPVATVVFPEIIAERSDSGQLLVAIRSGQTLSLRKTSVFLKRLEVTTLEDNRRTFHYMNGSGMERNLYHDPQTGAAVMLKRARGLRLVGILSPTERIQPSPTSQYHPRGSIKHEILPLAQRKSDNEISLDARLEGLDQYSRSTKSDILNKTENKVLEARSRSSPYPVIATCETRIAVDSAFFRSFRYNKEELLEYLAVLVAFNSEESFIKKPWNDTSVMLSDTLANFNSYVNDNQIFRYDDVVVLITGLDLAANYGANRAPGKSIAGYAHIGTACTRNKAGIVEDVPRTFSSAHTMAHEIAHLIGSVHDGSTNSHSNVNMALCPASENKIMSPTAGTYKRQEFSYCSTVQVVQFILIGKGKCLQDNIATKHTTKLTFNDVNKTRPSLNEFCRRHYTEHSGTGYIEYGINRLSLENCMITCTWPTRPGYVFINDAPDGTSCSKSTPHSICINGKCTRIEDVQTFGDDVKYSVDYLR